MRLLTFFLLLLSFSINAQNNSIKIYSNISYLNARIVPIKIDAPRALLEFNGVEFGYARDFSDKGFLQVLGGVFYRDRNDNTYEYSRRGYRIQGEVGRYLFKTKDDKLRLYGSAQIRFFSLKEDITRSQLSQPAESSEIGVHAGFIAGVVYNLSHAIYVELGINVLGASLSYDSLKFVAGNNPSNPDQLGSLDFRMGGRRSARLGVGYKF